MRIMGKIRWFYYRLRETNWKAFFLKNGPGEIIDKRFTGFRDSPYDYVVHGQWIARITGKNREHKGPSMFYTNVTVDGEQMALARGDWKRSQYLRNKCAEAERHLDSFADANCRCRLGFHWKCGIHRKWVG